MSKLTNLAPLALLALVGAAALLPMGATSVVAQSSSEPSSSFSSQPPDSSEPGNPGGPGGPGGGPGSPGSSYVPPPLNFGKSADTRKPLISCRTITTETSVRFRNIGQILIKAGTPISWQVKATSAHGVFSLPRDLKPGETLSGAELLKAGAPADARCLSQIG
jgi:hypothetical protein